ncbi:MAG: hypothetical protein V4640_03295 [Verrucomicrobiota bacterium]
MKRYIILAILMTAFAHGVELHTLEHKVIHDERTHIRDGTDRRYSIWTADPSKATKLLKNFGIVVPDFQIRKGQVLAVFVNDNITHDLAQIVYNKTANDTFADYADSGIMFKLKALEAGKKYSHVTAVVFTPVGTPNHLGVRGMIPGGLSEKQ